MRFGERLSFDFRELLTDASNARDAGALMWALVRELLPQVLVGPGFGATPLLYGMAAAALDEGINLQVLMVRDKRKDRNQKRWVEGNRRTAEGKRAIFVDDFMKAGSALPLVREALQADKVKVDLCAIALFFDMWEPLGSRQVSVSQLPVVSLYTRHDVGLSRDCFDAVPPTMRGAAPDFIPDKPRWWRFELHRSSPRRVKSAPAIVGEGAIVADDRSQLWRHHLQTGEVEWITPSLERPEKGIVQMLQVVDDTVVYGCYDGSLTRLHAATGDVLWRRKIDSSIHATPSIDAQRGTVIVNTEQWNRGKPIGHLQCLDLYSGKLLWRHAHGWWPPGSSLLCADAGLVVAPCNDQTLVAVDRRSGGLVWRVRTKGLVRGRAVLAGHRLLVATELGHLECRHLASGDLCWTVRYGAGLWHQFPQVAAGCVIVMDGKWHVSAFDLDTGALHWVGRLRSPGCWQAVPYGPYLVVLSRQGHLAVFCPRRGIKVWEGRLPGAFHQPPALNNGSLVAASNTAGFMAFDIHPFYDN